MEGTRFPTRTLDIQFEQYFSEFGRQAVRDLDDVRKIVEHAFITGRDLGWDLGYRQGASDQYDMDKPRFYDTGE